MDSNQEDSGKERVERWQQLRTRIVAPGARATAPSKEAPRELRFGDAWDYSPAPESCEVKIESRYGHFINGEFRDPAAGAWLPTVNPATEKQISEIAAGGEKDVDRAVQAARKAQPRWARLPGTERAKYLFRIARRIQERSRELAVLETLDGGKPIKETRDIDLPESAKHFFYHAGWADKLTYALPGRVARPIGVCAQIIPWNYPLLMAAWKLAPALCCGNTVVLKPAETTSLTALRLAEILQEIELPPGVVNMVTGDGETGAMLAAHSKVDKIAFTGSTEVGKTLARAAAGTGKRLTLELGGKSPNIVFEDADIDQAVEGVVGGIYVNQGQICSAGSRLFVQESVMDEVIQKLEIRMRSLRLGDPLDKNTDVGAINSRRQLDRIRKYLRLGTEEGARLREVDSTPLPDQGWFCRPAFFTGVQPAHTIAREEIFGPVLAVMSFRTPEEAIERANNTPYGLAAGVWTEKGSKIFALASRLKARVVWLNCYNEFDASSPFGGYKESGFGREGGIHGLRAYLDG